MWRVLAQQIGHPSYEDICKLSAYSNPFFLQLLQQGHLGDKTSRSSTSLTYCDPIGIGASLFSFPSFLFEVSTIFKKRHYIVAKATIEQ